KRVDWLRHFVGRTGRAHRFNRQSGGYLHLDDEALARVEPGRDPMQDVRPRELVLARGKELAEEPGVDVLDVFEAAVRRADDVVAALETRWFHVAFFFRFAAHGQTRFVLALVGDDDHRIGFHDVERFARHPEL